MTELWEEFDLSCPQCGWGETCNRRGALARLRQAGFFKKNAHPEPAELQELLLAVCGRLPCPDCGRVGIRVQRAQVEQADWGEARLCQGCGRPIPAERLEALPQTTHCVACAGSAEAPPRPTTDEDSCPRCGGVLRIELSRTSGVARYVAVCTTPGCGRGRRSG